MKQATFLKINPVDSVVVCLQPKQKGDLSAAETERGHHRNRRTEDYRQSGHACRS